VRAKSSLFSVNEVRIEPRSTNSTTSRGRIAAAATTSAERRADKMLIVDGHVRYAVASCHVERALDDAVWGAFSRLLERKPGGLVVTPLIRPPAAGFGEREDLWLERAREAASLAPLGHHTHWGGPTQARPTEAIDAPATVRAEAEWLRVHGLEARFFCGGGWYMDVPVAEVLAEHGYVDCTSTAFRQTYLAAGAPRLELAAPTRLRLPSGASLLSLPATHSAGMLGRRFTRLPDRVHVHFHDWELVQPGRGAAITALLRLLARRREPLTVAELASRAATAPEAAWEGVTIAR